MNMTALMPLPPNFGVGFLSSLTPIARDAGEPVCTPYDDCVLVMPSVRQLRPGVTTVRLGQRVHAPLE